MYHAGMHHDSCSWAMSHLTYIPIQFEVICKTSTNLSHEQLLLNEKPQDRQERCSDLSNTERFK